MYSREAEDACTSSMWVQSRFVNRICCCIDLLSRDSDLAVTWFYKLQHASYLLGKRLGSHKVCRRFGQEVASLCRTDVI